MKRIVYWIALFAVLVGAVACEETTPSANSLAGTEWTGKFIDHEINKSRELVMTFSSKSRGSCILQDKEINSTAVFDYVIGETFLRIENMRDCDFSMKSLQKEWLIREYSPRRMVLTFLPDNYEIQLERK